MVLRKPLVLENGFVGEISSSDSLSIPSVNLLSGSAAAPTLTFTGSSTGIYSPGADTLAASTGGSERLRITSAGLVGIGTSSPQAIVTSKPSSAFSTSTSVFTGEGLHIDASSATAGIGLYGGSITWSRNGTAGTKNAAIASVQTGADSDLGGLAFFTHQSTSNADPLVEAVRIDSNGRVGIGTTSPITTFQVGVNGTATASLRSAETYVSIDAGYQTAAVNGTAANPCLIFGGDGNTGFWHPAADTVALSNNGSESLRIDSSGRLLVGTSTAESIGGNDAALLQISSSNGIASIRRFTASSAGPILRFGKSRAATLDNTIVLAGDSLGQLAFAGADGTDVNSVAATITAEVDGTPGANDMPGRLVFSTTADGASSPTERLRISNDGSSLFTPGGSGSIKVQANFRFNNNEGFVQQNTGRALICAVGTTGGVELVNGGTSWGALSDERYKTDLVPIENGLEKTAQLRAVTGRYVDDAEDVSRSFLIAQDVQSVLPEAVSGSNDGEERLSLRYTEVIPLLVAALKESKERIETLEAKVAALEAS